MTQTLTPDTHTAPPSLPLIPYVITCLIASLITGAIAWASIDSSSTARDSSENRLLAYNIAKHGVFSLDTNDIPGMAPTMYREPLYPLYLAAVLHLFVDVDDLSRLCLIREPECESTRLLINRAIIPFYIVLVWAFTAVAYWIIHRWWIVWGMLLVLLWADYFKYYVPLTELPAALLLLIHAMFLYRIILDLKTDQKPYKFAVISGLGLGALILVKTVFQYWILLLVLVAGVAFLWHGRRSTILTRSLLLLSITASLILAPWLARNVVQFNDLKIAGRDELVLAVRAEYTYMTWDEYIASFAYFTSPLLKQRLLPLVDADNVHRWARAHPDGSLNEDSYYYRGTRRTGMVAARAIELYGSTSDKALSSAALSVIRDNWVKYAAFTLTAAWRGTFLDGFQGTMDSHQRVYETRFYRYQHYPRYLMYSFVPSMLGVAAYALIKRRWALLAFLLPALYSFGIHAVATHYIPRYSAPLVPIFIISLGLVIRGVVEWVRSSVHQIQGVSI